MVGDVLRFTDDDLINPSKGAKQTNQIKSEISVGGMIYSWFLDRLGTLYSKLSLTLSM